MLVVLSDLHFSSPATLAPSDFEQLWRHLDLLADRCRASSPITIVLAGDILEILRSERWLDDRTRPYNFTGEPDAPTLATARTIGDTILDDNAATFAALAGPGGARFVILHGNHDRLLREAALEPVRARLTRALGGDVAFADTHADERHRAFVHHGHELDWTCAEHQHARLFPGLDAADPARRTLAPLGDWIGLELGTRLPHLACQMLASEDRRWDDLPPPSRGALIARLVDLDDLRPQVEVLRWLLRPASMANPTAPAAETAAMSRFLGDLMSELITPAMPIVEPWLEAHGRPLFDRLALGAVTLLGSSRYASSTPRLIEKIQSYLATDDKPWSHLPRLPAWRDPTWRYFVSGHTHIAEVLPLRDSPGLPHPGAAADEDAHWYLNTGTWRRAILRSPLESDSYGSLRQLAFAVFFDDEESRRSTSRPGPSFDFWQCSTQRS